LGARPVGRHHVAPAQLPASTCERPRTSEEPDRGADERKLTARQISKPSLTRMAQPGPECDRCRACPAGSCHGNVALHFRLRQLARSRLQTQASSLPETVSPILDGRRPGRTVHCAIGAVGGRRTEPSTRSALDGAMQDALRGLSGRCMVLAAESTVAALRSGAPARWHCNTGWHVTAPSFLFTVDALCDRCAVRVQSERCSSRRTQGFVCCNAGVLHDDTTERKAH
jgi:hypothetical protein